MSKEVLVRVQPTPNPMAIKFILDRDVKTAGKATFTNIQQAQGLPLLETLFTVPGIRQIYLFQNTMTVTHTGDLTDDELVDQVIPILKTRMAIHDPDFKTPEEEKKPTKPSVDRTGLPEDLRRIEEILDRTVRPGLQADGGDLDVVSFVDNEVKVLYQGACGGCPSAMMGTLDAIQGILQSEMNNVDLIVTPV